MGILFAAPNSTACDSNQLNQQFKQYNPIGGTNHVILDKGKSLKKQIILKNTIYDIYDDFDLMGTTIQVPEGSTLNFKGGTISNGKLVGANTRIVAPFGRIFQANVSFGGKFLSDFIRMAWWGTMNANDNTQEVQSALDAIYFFVNRNFVFDMPVRITDISYADKYCPGTSFSGVSNSHQNNCAITVFGNDSHGLDISGTEILQFSNILFLGDEKSAPNSLLYASRSDINKQCNKHCFNNVVFRGEVTNAFAYNYGGEEWTFTNCEFHYSGEKRLTAMYYATSINSSSSESKFVKTEKKVTSLTRSVFNQCQFYNTSTNPSVYFEGGINKTGYILNIASVYFNQCYFKSAKGTSVLFKEIQGNISFINNVDESGSTNNFTRSNAFYVIEGNTKVDGLIFLNNTFYCKKNTPILNASANVENYYASSNKVINSGAIWIFKNLTIGNHVGLSSRERFVVEGKASKVEVKNNDGQVSNVSVEK